MIRAFAIETPKSGKSSVDKGVTSGSGEQLSVRRKLESDHETRMTSLDKRAELGLDSDKEEVQVRLDPADKDELLLSLCDDVIVPGMGRGRGRGRDMSDSLDRPPPANYRVYRDYLKSANSEHFCPEVEVDTRVAHSFAEEKDIAHSQKGMKTNEANEGDENDVLLGVQGTETGQMRTVGLDNRGKIKCCVSTSVAGSETGKTDSVQADTIRNLTNVYLKKDMETLAESASYKLIKKNTIEVTVNNKKKKMDLDNVDESADSRAVSVEAKDDVGDDGELPITEKNARRLRDCNNGGNEEGANGVAVVTMEGGGPSGDSMSLDELIDKGRVSGRRFKRPNSQSRSSGEAKSVQGADLAINLNKDLDPKSVSLDELIGEDNERGERGFNRHSGGWTPRTPREEEELADICSKSIFASDTKELLESTMRQLSLGTGPEHKMYNHYVFKLDNAERQTDFAYKIQDLPLIEPALVQGEMEFEITKFKALTEIVVKPSTELFQNLYTELCSKIGGWMGARNNQELESLRPSTVLKEDEMCIVLWPRSWEEVYTIMRRRDSKDEDAWWYQNLEEDCKLNIFYKDYKQFSGKWFRGGVVVPYRNAEAEIELYEMFLVDLGITTLILAKDVYRMPHRLMLHCPLTLFVSVKLDETTQYSHEVDEKWKYLLLPGMKIKAKILWMFDENNVIRLIKPSQREFEEHFRNHSVVAAIQEMNERTLERQRHRKVRKMSVLKGSFPANMKKVLDQEAEEKALKEERREYSGIGRVHPDHIFELCLPKPTW